MNILPENRVAVESVRAYNADVNKLVEILKKDYCVAAGLLVLHEELQKTGIAELIEFEVLPIIRGERTIKKLDQALNLALKVLATLFSIVEKKGICHEFYAMRVVIQICNRIQLMLDITHYYLHTVSIL